MKKVSFGKNTKDYDGSSQKSKLFYNFIMNFLNKEVSIENFISEITDDLQLISDFLYELKLILNKLDESAIFERYKSSNNEEYIEHTRYKVGKIEIPIIREGSRDYIYKFNKYNIPQVKLMIKFLEDVEELLFFSLI
jgi:hypothetical protein